MNAVQNLQENTQSLSFIPASEFKQRTTEAVSDPISICARVSAAPWIF